MKTFVFTAVPKLGLVQHVVNAQTWGLAVDRVQRAHPTGRIVAAITRGRYQVGSKIELAKERHKLKWA